MHLCEIKFLCKRFTKTQSLFTEVTIKEDRGQCECYIFSGCYQNYHWGLNNQLTDGGKWGVKRRVTVNLLLSRYCTL
jgi:hypothetical protein